MGRTASLGGLLDIAGSSAAAIAVPAAGQVPAGEADGESVPGAVGASADPVDRWLLVAAAVCALLSGGVNLFRYPGYAEGEGIYAMQAWAVLHGRLAPYAYWYDHPFLGWVQIAPFLAVGRWLAPGAGPVGDARLAMLVALAVDAALIFLIARRLGLLRPAAVLAVALFVLSPLVQTDMRRVFLDNIATPWLLAAFACALTRRPWWEGRFGAGACLAVAVLSKETSLLFAPAVLAAVAGGVDRPHRRAVLRSAGWSLAAVVGLYPLYALLRGQLLPAAHRASLLKAVRWQLASRSGSGSVFDPTSARHRLLMLWLSHDRLLVAGGMAAATLLLAVRRLRPVGVAAVIPMLWVARPGGYMPSMFEVALLPFLALALAALADTAVDLAVRAARLVHGSLATAVAGLLSLALITCTVPAQQRLHASDVYVVRDNQLPWQAVAWIDQHVPLGDRMLVDDVIWIGMATAGRTDPWQTLWMYVPDTNPATARRMPNGWKDIQWVVSTRTLRLELNSQPRFANARRALYHSQIVVTFGAGLDRIELRRVTPEPTP